MLIHLQTSASDWYSLTVAAANSPPFTPEHVSTISELLSRLVKTSSQLMVHLELAWHTAMLPR